MKKKQFGAFGEEQAGLYLEQKGYRVIAKNFRTKLGEIDIIVQKGKRITFVEVKSRTSVRFGLPREAVSVFKLRHMIKSAQYFLKVMKLDQYPYQFDVIEVTMNASERPVITHIENVTL